MEEIFIFLIVVFAVIIFIYTIVSFLKNQNPKKKIRKEIIVEQFVLLKEGYWESGRLYNIVSRNSGESWYVIRIFEDNKTKFIGNIEDTHPQVLRDKVAWNNLMNYIKQNGSIGLTDKKGVKLLQRCGFEVRLKN